MEYVLLCILVWPLEQYLQGEEGESLWIHSWLVILQWCLLRALWSNDSCFALIRRFWFHLAREEDDPTGTMTKSFDRWTLLEIENRIRIQQLEMLLWLIFSILSLSWIYLVSFLWSIWAFYILTTRDYANVGSQAWRDRWNRFLENRLTSDQFMALYRQWKLEHGEVVLLRYGVLVAFLGVWMIS